MDLTGRGALVTGGSGDLGTAICRALAAGGVDVVVGYVGNKDGAAKTCTLVSLARGQEPRIRRSQPETSAISSAQTAWGIEYSPQSTR
jgi:3-oxoacyl-[acyl-carrier protein] reductase